MYAPVDGAHRFVTMSTNADIRRILGSVLTRIMHAANNDCD